jgi:hypothetical protein
MLSSSVRRGHSTYHPRPKPFYPTTYLLLSQLQNLQKEEEELVEALLLV